MAQQQQLSLPSRERELKLALAFWVTTYIPVAPLAGA